jgi:hypothetical protein
MIEQTHGASALPTIVGIGLRLQHFSEIIATPPLSPGSRCMPRITSWAAWVQHGSMWRAATTR